ncbi:peptidylprolyl isomerase [Niabella pedocola]|uniref:Peptidylprolyl isomerase n=1 Tax=Niabella pedocola TaxID=1752077 RepID=A0ABS8PS28_9BACT|nr:peptidylprolyl isomerase [Niabella pedocola]MCD2423882.1 peptidylprolyl isomerase [Niabella pedocola]
MSKRTGLFSVKGILAAVGILFSTLVTAQGQASKQVVDKIIGVVGDRIILNSDVQNELNDAPRRGETLPPNANCIIMEQIMLSKILALQAERDSIPLTDEEVEAQLDMKIRYYIQQFGSQAELESVAGKTVYQLKDDQRPLIKEQMLAERMKNKVVSGVHITPTEVKTFFEKVPADSLPFLESELEVGQISILPSASKDVDDYIYNEMVNYKKQIESGSTTFDALAKRVSEDPGSRERGGLYEINRSDKSTWDPVFLSTAFRLKAGEISLPVKSNRFGFFLIQQISRRGDNAKIKMILRIPPVTENELKEARLKLDSVHAEIEAKKISFKDAAYKYSDDENVKNYGPYVLNRDGSTYVNIDALDKDMVNTIKDMKVGDLSRPVNFTNDQGKKGVRLVYLKSRSEPHRLNLNDDYAKIADMALGQKKNQELDKWLQKKIPTFYILVDKDAAGGCPSLLKYQTTENRGF